MSSNTEKIKRPTHWILHKMRTIENFKEPFSVFTPVIFLLWGDMQGILIIDFYFFRLETLKCNHSVRMSDKITNSCMA